MNELKLRSFLDDLNVEYIDSGKNHKAGNINIRCPYCGEEDPSYHLGISYISDFFFAGVTKHIKALFFPCSERY